MDGRRGLVCRASLWIGGLGIGDGGSQRRSPRVRNVQGPEAGITARVVCRIKHEPGKGASTALKADLPWPPPSWASPAGASVAGFPRSLGRIGRTLPDRRSPARRWFRRRRAGSGKV